MRNSEKQCCSPLQISPIQQAIELPKSGEGETPKISLVSTSQGSLVEAGPLHLAIAPRPLAGGDTTPVADTSSLALFETRKGSLDVYIWVLTQT